MRYLSFVLGLGLLGSSLALASTGPTTFGINEVTPIASKTANPTEQHELPLYYSKKYLEVHPWVKNQSSPKTSNFGFRMDVMDDSSEDVWCYTTTQQALGEIYIQETEDPSISCNKNIPPCLGLCHGVVMH